MEEFVMSKNARKCFNELKKKGCPVKEWYSDERGHFWIDAEEDCEGKWLNYWGNEMYFGSDLLRDTLSKYELWFSWCNSAYAHVYDI